MRSIFGILILLSVASISEARQSTVFTQIQICRAAIAVAFGQDPKIIKVDRVTKGVVYMHYNRPDDGKYWDCKCKIKGNRAIWASPNERWRTEEIIEYTVIKDKLIVEDKYSDGSKTTGSYTQQQFVK